MSTALTRTWWGYGAIAQSQRISLSGSAATADTRHHHRREQSTIFLKYGGRGCCLLGRQQSGLHDGFAQAFKGQPKEIKAGRRRIDQPGPSLPPHLGETGSFHVTDYAPSVVTLESCRRHEVEDDLTDFTESDTPVLESVVGPVVVLDDHPPAGLQRGDQPLENLPAIGE